MYACFRVMRAMLLENALRVSASMRESAQVCAGVNVDDFSVVN